MNKTAEDQFMEARAAMISLFLVICKELKIDRLIEWLNRKISGED